MFSLSWQLHQWLIFFLWKTSQVALSFGLQLLLIASQAISNLTTHLCVHYLWLPVVFLLLSCILGCWCMFILHLCLCPFWVSLHLCLSYGCAWITSSLGIAVVLLCTGSFSCIGGCVILVFVVCVTDFIHPFGGCHQHFVMCYHLKAKAAVVEFSTL